MDITAWLNRLGLQQYEPAFRENDVDAEVLPELTAEDLIGRQIGPVEPCQTQITAAQIGCSERGPSEERATQSRLSEVALVEQRLAKPGSSQVGLA